MCGAELNKIIVIPADSARGFAYRFDFDAGHLWQSSRKELVLHFTGDGNFVFQPLALLLLFDQATDGAGHQIERFAEYAQLIATLDTHAMRQVASLHILGRAIKFVHRFSDLPGKNQASSQRCGLNYEKSDKDKNKRDEIRIPQFAQRAEHTAAQL